MQAFFITMQLFMLISIAYLIYFLDNRKKLKKYRWIFLCILAICNIVFGIIFPFILNEEYGTVYLLVLLCATIGICFLLAKMYFISVIFFIVYMVLFSGISATFKITTEIASSVQTISLSSTSNYSNEGEILLEFSNFKEYENDIKTHSIAYSIMKYNKDDVNKFKLPLYCTPEYEVIYKKNDRIEVTIIETRIDTILSYFKFYEVPSEYDISYKVYINKENIKYH